MLRKSGYSYKKNTEEIWKKDIEGEGKILKYITFTVPCYNSEAYMERCIDSLLAGGEDVEILIIDDGSTDRTGEIADYYEKLYPGIVRAVHKENGGHGSGVNEGLRRASGVYFKVVDSDDWLDETAYRELLHMIRFFCGTGSEQKNRKLQKKQNLKEMQNPKEEQKLKKTQTMQEMGQSREEEDSRLTEDQPDLFVCNYVYDHLEEGRQTVVNYRNVFPRSCVCTWREIKRFKPSQYLVMHALIFRTELLKKCGIRLPEHCFYVDNLFANQPLPYVDKICYLNVDLYHYYLGREDQSVNERVLCNRIDQQIKVTNLVSRCTDLSIVEAKYPRLASYLCRNVSIMMAISSIHLLLIGDKEAYRKRKELWQGIRRDNKKLYYRLRFSTISSLTYLPGALGRALTLGGYRMARNLYQFQ